MMAILNRVRRGFYADSVELMRISRGLASRHGIEAASAMIGTASNLELLREAGLLTAEAEKAGANDLIIAVRGEAQAAEAALEAADALFDAPPAHAATARFASARGLEGALELEPAANLALISVPGAFAAAEAMRALARGLHVMIFSDNVPIEEEVALKRAAAAKGLFVMGPDCGTCIIGGVPIAFANAVPRGDIGIVSASGTGLQEVSSLLGRFGGGVSHGIGVGGRDLKEAVGGVMTLQALEALDADPATRHIVLISKPPAENVAARIVARISNSRKTFTVCFLGARAMTLPPNARFAATLQEAAEDAGGFKVLLSSPADLPVREGAIRGLYAGGTLCAEAQLVLLRHGLSVFSNVPVPGARDLSAASAGSHSLIDLGDDLYTRGRPHPMIDPAVRDAELSAALADPRTAVVLLDVVIGYGAHPDPAKRIVDTVRKATTRHAVLIASVTGTDADQQGHARQTALLQSADILVAGSNAQAALWAAGCVSGR
jgi:FdrA protein